MTSMFSLADKVAIVTGAGRGIGRGIALGLAQAGADIVIADLLATEAEKTAAKIRTLGRKSLAVLADVRSDEQIANMVKRTLDEFYRIDILVNNVGVFGRQTPTLKVTGEDWESLLQANLKGAFLCCKAVAEAMIRQEKGSIINISSLGGILPPLGFTAYNAAKAGVINMTQSLAVEWGPQHIRVNCIAPGWIETPFNSPLGFLQAPFVVSALKRVPLQRPGKPDDIAGAAIYLASDAADYVTGLTIIVDGGLHSVQAYG